MEPMQIALKLYDFQEKQREYGRRAAKHAEWLGQQPLREREMILRQSRLEWEAEMEPVRREAEEARLKGILGDEQYKNVGRLKDLNRDRAEWTEEYGSNPDMMRRMEEYRKGLEAEAFRPISEDAAIVGSEEGMTPQGIQTLQDGVNSRDEWLASEGKDATTRQYAAQFPLLAIHARTENADKFLEMLPDATKMRNAIAKSQGIVVEEDAVMDLSDAMQARVTQMMELGKQRYAELRTNTDLDLTEKAAEAVVAATEDYLGEGGKDAEKFAALDAVTRGLTEFFAMDRQNAITEVDAMMKHRFADAGFDVADGLLQMATEDVANLLEDISFNDLNNSVEFIIDTANSGLSPSQATDALRARMGTDFMAGLHSGMIDINSQEFEREFQLAALRGIQSRKSHQPGVDTKALGQVVERVREQINSGTKLTGAIGDALNALTDRVRKTIPVKQNEIQAFTRDQREQAMFRQQEGIISMSTSPRKGASVGIPEAGGRGNELSTRVEQGYYHSPDEVAKGNDFGKPLLALQNLFEIDRENWRMVMGSEATFMRQNEIMYKTLHKYWAGTQPGREAEREAVISQEARNVTALHKAFGKHGYNVTWRGGLHPDFKRVLKDKDPETERRLVEAVETLKSLTALSNRDSVSDDRRFAVMYAETLFDIYDMVGDNRAFGSADNMRTVL